jgi:hypothetical protein
LLGNFLDWAVVILPAAFGFMVELLDERIRKRPIWKVGVVVFGIVISVSVYFQQRISRESGSQVVAQLKEQMTQEGKTITAEIDSLVARLNPPSVLSPKHARLPNLQKNRQPSPTNTEQVVTPVAPTVHVPTTEELATAVADKLRQEQSIPKEAAVTPQEIRPCRGDDLRDCTDEQLAVWVRPLTEKLRTISGRYSSDMEAISKHKQSLLGALIRGDDTPKLLDQADQRAADTYRECCAQDMLKYEQEMSQRVGAGSRDAHLCEWSEKLLSPIGSREWKSARKEGGGGTRDAFYRAQLFPLELQSKRSSDEYERVKKILEKLEQARKH